MSPVTRQRWSALLGMALLAALAYCAFVAMRGALSVIDSLKSDLAVAIIAAGATILVSILSIVLANIYQARERIQNQYREKKTPVYEEVLQFISRVMSGEKIGNAPTDIEMKEFFLGFNQKMMVWGADRVLAAWIKWLRAIMDADSMKKEPMLAVVLYEDLILAIRRDLGHKNKELRRGDVLRLFVTDIDKHLPAARK